MDRVRGREGSGDGRFDDVRVSGADDLGVEDDFFSLAFEMKDFCFAMFFFIRRFKGLLLKCVDHLVEALELAVGPARDVHLATDLLQNCGADAEVLCDLGDGLVEVLLQRDKVNVGAVQLGTFIAHGRLGLRLGERVSRLGGGR